jgi:hypothetical protein
VERRAAVRQVGRRGLHVEQRSGDRRHEDLARRNSQLMVAG